MITKTELKKGVKVVMFLKYVFMRLICMQDYRNLQKATSKWLWDLFWLVLFCKHKRIRNGRYCKPGSTLHLMSSRSIFFLLKWHHIIWMLCHWNTALCYRRKFKMFCKIKEVCLKSTLVDSIDHGPFFISMLNTFTSMFKLRKHSTSQWNCSS